MVKCKFTKDEYASVLINGRIEKGVEVSNRRNEKENETEKIWVKPEEGWMKINCDGAFSKEKGKVGCRVVVRNCSTELIEGVAKQITADNALILEALACREAIIDY
ncbi:hypothetical protein DITRI_Ditri15bG0041000 [Diplodiscus trichospermus]